MAFGRGMGVGLAVWVVAIPIFLFTILVLVGCTSDGMSGMYILDQAWNDKTRVRLGYYGMCFTNAPRTICHSTSSKSTSQVIRLFNLDGNDDNNKTGISQLLRLQNRVFTAFMTAAGIFWLLSLVLVSVVIVTGGTGSRVFRTTTRTITFISVLLMVASAWSTGQAVAAVNTYISEKALFRSGTTLIALQWVAAILNCFYAWAVTHVTSADRETKIARNANNYQI